ncbi:MAG: hypothetical protein HY712_02735, partial [candidate division NC10 bacterium]|nr:hypothetical protein [candidate division NC10 bacterium]
MTSWKEELVRAARELAEERGEQPATSADDQAVDERLSALLAAAGEDGVLSEATADALGEFFAGQELSPALRQRLRATMARAQEERAARQLSVPADWSLG